MVELFYIAIKNGRDVEYIYKPYEPKIGDRIQHNGKQWEIVGYMSTKNW